MTSPKSKPKLNHTCAPSSVSQYCSGSPLSTDRPPGWCTLPRRSVPHPLRPVRPAPSHRHPSHRFLQQGPTRSSRGQNGSRSMRQREDEEEGGRWGRQSYRPTLVALTGTLSPDFQEREERLAYRGGGRVNAELETVWKKRVMLGSHYKTGLRILRATRTCNRGPIPRPGHTPHARLALLPSSAHASPTSNPRRHAPHPSK